MSVSASDGFCLVRVKQQLNELHSLTQEGDGCFPHSFTKQDEVGKIIAEMGVHLQSLSDRFAREHFSLWYRLHDFYRRATEEFLNDTEEAFWSRIMLSAVPACLALLDDLQLTIVMMDIE